MCARGAACPDEEALLPDVPFGLVVLAGSVTIFGPLAAWVALARGRFAPLWFVYGAILGPIAVAILLAAPPGRCQACGWRVRGWTDTCLACGNDVTTGLPPEGEVDLSRTPGIAAAAPPVLSIAPGSDATGGTRFGRSGGAPVAVGPGRPDPGLRFAGGSGVLAATRDQRASAVDAGWTSGSAAVAPARSAPDDWDPVPLSIAPAAPDSEPDDDDDRPFAVLGSGVFVGGNRPLQPGSRYLLARVGPELQVFGPLHLNPASVATRMATKDIEVTVVGDRLTIGGNSPLMDVALAFVGITVEPGVDIRAAFRPRRAATPRR